jgi:hypothetical protein
VFFSTGAHACVFFYAVHMHAKTSELLYLSAQGYVCALPPFPRFIPPSIAHTKHKQVSGTAEGTDIKRDISVRANKGRMSGKKKKNFLHFLSSSNQTPQHTSPPLLHRFFFLGSLFHFKMQKKANLRIMPGQHRSRNPKY